MELGGLAGEGSKALGARATLANLLPAALLTLLLVILIGSGAPGDPSLGRVIDTFGGLEGARLAVLGLVVLAVAVILQPFQIAVVQLLEGYWSASPLRGGSAIVKKARKLGIEIQRRRHRALSILQVVSTPRFTTSDRDWAEDEAAFYPDYVDLLPTRLGNVLRAAEIRAGGRYGLDAVDAFPRLYPQMSDRLARAWEDLTDQLDTAAHMCVTFLLATFISVCFLAPYGWDGFWLLIPAGAAVLTWISYRAAIAAAKQQGVVLMAAFDLHRFDLLASLHYPLPKDARAEFEFNQRLAEFFAGADTRSRAEEFKTGEPMEPAEPYEHPAPTIIATPGSPTPEPEPVIWEWDAVDAALGGDGDRVRNEAPPAR
jgi:hypothetical protein